MLEINRRTNNPDHATICREARVRTKAKTLPSLSNWKAKLNLKQVKGVAGLYTEQCSSKPITEQTSLPEGSLAMRTKQITTYLAMRAACRMCSCSDCIFTRLTSSAENSSITRATCAWYSSRSARPVGESECKLCNERECIDLKQFSVNFSRPLIRVFRWLRTLNLARAKRCCQPVHYKAVS